MKKKKDTYRTVDGVYLGLDDEVWIAALDLDSFNYTPKALTVRKCIAEGQTAFWSNEADCINECEDANSL